MSVLAIINNETNRVDNIIVPPEGADAWFVPSGYTAVLSDDAAIGDTYQNGQLIKPDPQPVPEA